jgi:hypothetical protein
MEEPMKDKEPSLEDYPILKEYEDVFGEFPGLLTNMDTDFSIDLILGVASVSKSPYRMIMPEIKELQMKLEELLNKGYIRPNVSPWVSPIIFLNKKNEMTGLSIEFRQLNKVTIKNKYTLPRTDDIFDQLKGENIFSKIDLRSGYHQVRIIEEDTRKKIFRTRYVPFGLKNIPSTFMCLMNGVLRDFLEKFVIILLDDIIIYLKTKEEHGKHLRMVLQVLREQKLYAKLSKCTFYQNQIHYLGHIVSKYGIAVDLENIEAIKS